MPSRNWSHELRQDAVITLRQLRRSPGFALVARLTLALGSGATTAVFAVVDAVLLALRQPRFQVTLVGTFAALALALGGWHPRRGVVHDAASHRELGVRMALGARAATWQVLVVDETLRTVGVGVVVGVIAAGAGAQLLLALIYEVSATDPATFIAVPVVVIAVAVLAAAIPARRALRVDPATVLRMD